ncbi:MAG TPA: LytTR family DNA-binding domain-containing protein [Draconibacterium sp.]|nr:LytTR family DNA-binding domain-containing protein [Draconibacterium sp.]
MDKTFKALIVEDIANTSDYIKQRIIKLCSAIDIPDQAFNIEEAFEMIQEGNYDIIFLDIQLPKGTGFDLLNKLSEKGKIDFEIIFITGESEKEHTLRAIKYSAIDFLYKPLDDVELVIAVNKAIEKLKNTYFNKQIKLLLDRVGHEKVSVTNKIAFHLHNGVIEFVNVQEIKYLQADGVISYIFLENGNKLTITKNLGYYKDMLIADYNFHLISNSLLVNHEFIYRYNHNELLVTLKDGSKLYASKRFGKEFKNSLVQNKTRKSLKNPLAFLWEKWFI